MGSSLEKASLSETHANRHSLPATARAQNISSSFRNARGADLIMPLVRGPKPHAQGREHATVEDKRRRASSRKEVGERAELNLSSSSISGPDSQQDRIYATPGYLAHPRQSQPEKQAWQSPATESGWQDSQGFSNPLFQEHVDQPETKAVGFRQSALGFPQANASNAGGARSGAEEESGQDLDAANPATNIRPPPGSKPTAEKAAACLPDSALQDSSSHDSQLPELNAKLREGNSVQASHQDPPPAFSEVSDAHLATACHVEADAYPELVGKEVHKASGLPYEPALQRPETLGVKAQNATEAPAGHLDSPVYFVQLTLGSLAGCSSGYLLCKKHIIHLSGKKDIKG